MSKYLTAPVKSSSLPKGFHIIGNEAAERFSFYGMRSILFVYMTTYLMQPGGLLDTFTDQEAKSWTHLFVASAYFSLSWVHCFQMPGGVSTEPLLHCR